MIDWDTLIASESSEQNPQNVDNCRNKTGFVGTFSENVGTLEAFIHAGLQFLFRLFRLFRQVFHGAGKKKKIMRPVKGWLQIIIARQKRIQ